MSKEADEINTRAGDPNNSISDPFRIAHLSDVHFNSKFDRFQWTYVREVLRKENPDLIVLTGDVVNHPSPLMLAMARRELLDLQETLGIPVVVIPGNHDVAFAGSVPVPLFTGVFHAMFSEEREQWIKDNFPTFISFYTKGWFYRFFYRFVLYTRITAVFFNPKLKPKQSRDKVSVYTGLGPLWMTSFDSTRSLILASGKVPETQIYDFGIHALDFDSPQTFEQALLPRIALLHHHLVPIPYTRNDISGKEPFLVLQNAGTVLKELCTHDFDLVLHGHRHYACFSRLAYGDQSHEPHEISILSAASPTVREPEAGFNSLHLVDLHRNGQIRIHERRFGSGMTIASPHHAVQPIIEALPLHSLKTRNFRRAVTLQLHECDEVAREVSIDSGGNSIGRLIISKLRVRPGMKMKFHTWKLQTSRGSLDPNAVYKVRDRQLWSPQCTLVAKSQSDDMEVEHEIRINPPLTEGVDINYALEQLSANNFAMTRWECDRTAKADRLESDHQYSPAEESIGIRIRFPTRGIRLRVQLPKTLHNKVPYVRCSMPRNYPHLRLDNALEVLADTSGLTDDHWEPDGKMSDYEKVFLRQLSEDTWEWRVDYPLVGYRYELCWQVEDVREMTADLALVGKTETCRKMFLDYANLATTQPESHIRDVVAKQLRTELLDKLYKILKDPITGSDAFRVGVFVYDEAKHELVLVDEVTTSGAPTAKPNNGKLFTIPFGDGVAGLTFKQCEATAYYKPAVNHHSGRGIDFFRKANELGLQAVLGVPIFHPEAWSKLERILDEGKKPGVSDFPGIREAIGVITIASDSEASGISQIAGQDSDAMLEVQGQVIAHVPALIRNISRAILENRAERP